MRLYDKARLYDSAKFSVRYRRLAAEVTSIAWAPAGQPFAGIAAVGTADGSVSFIDFSIFDQVRKADRDRVGFLLLWFGVYSIAV